MKRKPKTLLEFEYMLKIQPFRFWMSNMITVLVFNLISSTISKMLLISAIILYISKTFERSQLTAAELSWWSLRTLIVFLRACWNSIQFVHSCWWIDRSVIRICVRYNQVVYRIGLYNYFGTTLKTLHLTFNTRLWNVVL